MDSVAGRIFSRPPSRLDRGYCSLLARVNTRASKRKRSHTLEELLAGILLEEGFVADGSSKIVDHQAENGQDLILRVACVV